MKIVVNRCFGGFSVSEAVYKELGLRWSGYGYPNNKLLDLVSDNPEAYRADPRLIAAIEKVGIEQAGGDFASLEIVEIPDDVVWEIDEYDGKETVQEKRRRW